MVTKPFFLEPHESPIAAAVIPLRGGSKATGNFKSFITAFFLKAQHSSLNLPTPLPSGWIMELPYFLEQEFSVTVQYGLLVPGGCGERPQNPLVLWWTEGAISPSALGTVAGCSALQVSLG